MSTAKVVVRHRSAHPHLRIVGFPPTLLRAPDPPWRLHPAAKRRVVAIGASTGGPVAVRQLVEKLPRDFPLPILLVIHVIPTLGAVLAEWLKGHCPIPVACATDGMRLPEVGQGRVIMAPGDRHLVLEDGCVRLSDGPERHACRPSVDVLFESVARQMGPESVGCLLTGMGRDGAEGLLALRRAGGLTLVQNEATCAVFGMPQEAIRLGAAERVLPLRKFAPALAELAGIES